MEHLPDQLLALFTIAVLAMIAAAMVALLVFYIPRIRRRSLEEQDGFCDSCGSPVNHYSPFSCFLCMSYLCCEPCKRRHLQRRHQVTAGPRRGPEAA